MNMIIDRRSFLKTALGAALAAAVPISMVDPSPYLVADGTVPLTADWVYADYVRHILADGLRVLRNQNTPLFPRLVGVVEPGTPAGEVIEMVIRPYQDK